MINTDSLREVAEQGGGRTTCPECSGGPSKQMSASVYHFGGRWMFKCHRAACGVSRPLDNSHMIPFNEKTVSRPYTGQVKFLPGGVYDWMFERYPLLCYVDPDLLDKVVRYNAENKTLLFPIRKHGKLVGYVERAAKPGEDSPLAVYHTIGPDWSAKTKTWYDRHSYKGSLAWYNYGAEGPCVLVEDSLSAICGSLIEPNVKWVALLGTGMNAAKVTELYQGGVDDVRIALDADATGAAFALAKKWGMGFHSCRVVPLQKDIKDMTLDEFNDLRFD